MSTVSKARFPFRGRARLLTQFDGNSLTAMDDVAECPGGMIGSARGLQNQFLIGKVDNLLPNEVQRVLKNACHLCDHLLPQAEIQSLTLLRQWRLTFRQHAVASRRHQTDDPLLRRRAMERALYIQPNLASPLSIQCASAVLPFVRRSAVISRGFPSFLEVLVGILLLSRSEWIRLRVSIVAYLRISPGHCLFVT